MVFNYEDYVISKKMKAKIIRNKETNIDIKSRYVLKLELDNDSSKKMAVIMQNPSGADEEYSDRTVNNILKLAYVNKIKYVYILNLYSYYGTDINKIVNLIIENDEENINDRWINRIIQHVEAVVVAWGTIEGNKSLQNLYDKRIEKVFTYFKGKNILVIDEDFTESRYLYFAR
ncbi:hypothetical protein MTP04_29990 [Lysinibacillus sp. PLM2]|nr:hypothetical protein MTP04_29990 [Lysinibacillus sp. PLM2]